jgi:Helix-turn-helix domain
MTVHRANSPRTWRKGEHRRLLTEKRPVQKLVTRRELFAGLPGDRVLAYEKDGTPVFVSVHEPDVDLTKVKLHLDDGSRLTNTKAKTLADEVIAKLSARQQSRAYALALGLRLRTARKQKGLTTIDVERISGGEFHHSTLGNYERGFRLPSDARLQRLAQLYGMPVEHLRPTVAGGTTRPTEPFIPGLKLPRAKSG